jgi:hypothetical protein
LDPPGKTIIVAKSHAYAENANGFLIPNRTGGVAAAMTLLQGGIAIPMIPIKITADCPQITEPDGE